MSPLKETYEGTLKNDRIEWKKEAPRQERGLHVEVTVLREEKTQDKGRGKQMATALKQLAESGAFQKIEDPVRWQREIRKDRPLNRREE